MPQQSRQASQARDQMNARGASPYVPGRGPLARHRHLAALSPQVTWRLPRPLVSVLATERARDPPATIIFFFLFNRIAIPCARGTTRVDGPARSCAVA